MSSVATRNGTQAQAAAGPGFTDTLAAEWAKLRTWRAIRWSFALAIVLSIAMSALLGLVIGATYDDWPASEQAQFDPILYPMNGIVASLIGFAVLGVMAVTPEYGNGLVRLTFTATPRRSRVVLAKVLIVTALTLVGGMASAFGMYFAGQAVFSTADLPTESVFTGDAMRAVLGIGLLMPVFPLLGLAIGFLTRSTAAGITGVLVLLWAPEIFGPLLPGWWQENVVSLLPGPAGDSVIIGHLVDSRTFSDPAVGALIVAAWLVGAIALSVAMVRRRDA